MLAKSKKINVWTMNMMVEVRCQSDRELTELHYIKIWLLTGKNTEFPLTMMDDRTFTHIPVDGWQWMILVGSFHAIEYNKNIIAVMVGQRTNKIEVVFWDTEMWLVKSNFVEVYMIQ